MQKFWHAWYRIDLLWMNNNLLVCWEKVHKWVDNKARLRRVTANSLLKYLFIQKLLRRLECSIITSANAWWLIFDFQSCFFVFRESIFLPLTWNKKTLALSIQRYHTLYYLYHFRRYYVTVVYFCIGFLYWYAYVLISISVFIHPRNQYLNTLQMLLLFTSMFFMHLFK